jgi:dTDP-4-dehydrorhamnose reductase
MNLLIIGKNSILSRLFLEHTKIKNYTVYSRRELKNVSFADYTHVLNFSFNPKLKFNKYNKKLDLDLKLVNKIKKFSAIYIFFSSRLVYSNDCTNKHKEQIKKIRPLSVYGKNKLIIENKIRKTVPNKHLILRLSTLLYYNLNFKRNLFSYQMLNSLKKNNEIRFDFSDDTYKDFITPEYFSKCLDKLIMNNMCGTYNICSGLKIYVKDITKKIIYGFKSGKVNFKEIKKNQSFLMSNNKLFNKIKVSLKTNEIYNYCIAMGKSIK